MGTATEIYDYLRLLYARVGRTFCPKCGREMRPDDPFFFDPDLPTPQFRSPDAAREALELLVELMAEAGVNPEAIYAFKATGGLFPLEDTLFTPDQEAEWNAAIHEYHEKIQRSRTQ